MPERKKSTKKESGPISPRPPNQPNVAEDPDLAKVYQPDWHSTSVSSAATATDSVQVRLLKVVVVILLVLIGATVAFVAISRRESTPVTIVLGGNIVGTARSREAATADVLSAEQQVVGTGFPQDSFVRLQRLQYEQAAGDAPIDPDDSLRQAIAGRIKFNVRAFVIMVDGHPSIGLPSEAAAIQTLALVKAHFLALTPAGPTVGDPTIKEKIVIDQAPVPATHCRPTPDVAAPYFWTPPKTRTYTVKEGDRGYTIAERHHVSFADFLAANAGRDMNKLLPGDMVNLQRLQPTVTVLVQKRNVVDEPIVPNVPASDAGSRRVTYLVTYANGTEAKRDIVTMQTLIRPIPRMSL